MRWALVTAAATFLWSGVCTAAETSSTFLMIPNIPVSNMEKSTKFYSEVFDLKVGFVVPPGAAIKDAREIVLTKDGKFDFRNTPALLLLHIGDKSLPPDRYTFKRIVIMTSDVKTVDARAKSLGAEQTVTASGSGRFLTDPDGYKVEVYQPPEVLPPG